LKQSLRNPEREKRRLRQQLRQQRMALPAATRMAAAESVAAALLAESAFLRPGYVAGYWAMAGELPLHALQLRLPATLVWCLPVIAGERRLGFAPWRSGDALVSNRYGIPEPDVAASSLLAPEAMSAVLLPLLACCRNGRRLGMGGGYYDRSFAFRQLAPSPPLLIGVAYAFQTLADLPAEPWDVRLDAIVDENGWRDCER
jgi:5-formyltetrahydrofolate cyclo-ligase